MVSTVLLKKAARKGKQKAGWPGMILLGTGVLLAQYVAKRRVKRYLN